MKRRDHALTAALRRAPSLVFYGVSTQNVKIADAVQLKGAAAAYKAISTACGLNVEEVKPAGKKNKKR